MAIDMHDMMDMFQEFLEAEYMDDLHGVAAKGAKSLAVDFFKLAKFKSEAAEQLLDDPDNTIKAMEEAMKLMGFKARARFKNLPESQKVMIRNVRAEHLGRFIALNGIIRQSSDVRPEAVSARYECPSCGNVITILQTDTKFKEPSRCSCGRKGHFRLLSKELIDAQRIVLEEVPQTLEGGAQPKRLSVFLRDDLVEPRMEKRTVPGTNVRVTGIVREVPIPHQQGGIKIRFDLAMEANHLEPVQEDFSEIQISKEDEAEIRKLAKDKNIYKKLINSIAPSIFGYEMIKLALALQMFGGVRKYKKDGTMIRGDTHILLVGDPGVAKSQMIIFVSKAAPKSRFVAGKGASGAGLCIAPGSIVLTNPGGMDKIEEVVEQKLAGNSMEYANGVWASVDSQSDKKIFTLDESLKLKSQHINRFWKLMPPERMAKLRTRSGKELLVTPNTKLYTISKGIPCWKEAGVFVEGDYVASARSLPLKNEFRQLPVFPLIKSNPIIYGAKPKVKEIIHKLSSGKTMRSLAKELHLNENQLYFHWVNEKARGNPHLDDITKLAKMAGVKEHELAPFIKEAALYRGKSIRLPTYINEDLMYFAGIIAGDGDLSAGKNSVSIRFSSSSEELLERFQSIAKSLFNVKCNVSSDGTKRTKSYRFGSNIVFDLLNAFGLPLSPKSHRIDLSDFLLHLPDCLIASFLKGYFDTDGCVVKRDKGSSYVELTTTSSVCAKKLQLLLMRWGIRAKMRKKKAVKTALVNAKFDKYSIEIAGIDNLILFRDKIGFGLSMKKEKLDNVISRISKQNTNVDIVPAANVLCRRVIKDCKLPYRKMGLGFGFLSGKTGISRNNLQRFVQRIKARSIAHENLPLLDVLSNSDIIWEKVTEARLERHKFPFVYDLTVEGSHNFLVNGIVVHNTAAVVKDEFLRGWALEAGAMVLADRGLLCIDELDKISKEDTAALHEGLEQQQISIAKANIQATLRTQTTVLAAANPKLGRFDPYGVIGQQIDLPPALISRFDLIFIMRDLPNKEKDGNIATQVLLNQSLMGAEPEISPAFLRKYIAYAKQLMPMLTEEARRDIKNFYVKLRNTGTSGDAIKPIPITPRHLDAIVRLAEASAKVRLSKEIMPEDAKRAIDLQRFCLLEVGQDPETGEIDVDRISGMPTSERGKIVGVREIIFQMSKEKKTIPVEEVLEEAEKRGIPRHKAEDAIDNLRRHGDIYEPKRGFIEKV
ncbi:MAG: ATP-binding protein [Nanoarchaeota archaeon]|nr:ATP-binding protein [Nanoarchaeota archaeon]